MIIRKHAVSNYIDRVLNSDENSVGEGVERFVREQLRKAASEPDTIYHGEKESVPIHIRNGVAVPVHTDNGEKEVRTAYNAGTFLSKMDHGTRQEAT